MDENVLLLVLDTLYKKGVIDDSFAKDYAKRAEELIAYFDWPDTASVPLRHFSNLIEHNLPVQTEPPEKPVEQIPAPTIKKK